MSITRDALQQKLKQLQIFNGLDDRGINALSAIIRLESYDTEEVIIQQGAPSNGIFILLEGSIRVSFQTSAGAIVVLDHLSKGNVFGTLSAIDRKERGATCTAADTVHVGRISMMDVQDLMYGSSALALGFQIVILRSIFQELRKTNAHLSELSALEALIVF